MTQKMIELIMRTKTPLVVCMNVMSCFWRVLRIGEEGDFFFLRKNFFRTTKTQFFVKKFPFFFTKKVHFISTNQSESNSKNSSLEKKIFPSTKKNHETPTFFPNRPPHRRNLQLQCRFRPIRPINFRIIHRN